ncbi:FG-GAP repeat domain-containing protein [Streptomyces acidicola]|uniref:FG-GAP repeat domain-containing protein n=1 Tax=Streptomyces acidicola TaxID=2596892 RepID=UPI003795DF93
MTTTTAIPAKATRTTSRAPAAGTPRRVTALLAAGLLLAATACTPDDPGSGKATDRRTTDPRATARPPAGTPASSPTARPPAGTPASSPKDLDTGDFNGDGYDDYAAPVRANSKKGENPDLVIVYGSAKGLRPEWSQRYTDLASNRLFRADLDGDGYTDLTARKEPDGARVWWGGPRGLSAPDDLAVPKDTRLIAVADFDGDGRNDLLDAGFKKSPYKPEVRDATEGRMLLGPYDRAGAPARTVPLDLGQDGWAAPASATTGDFDGDGRAEVLLRYQCENNEDDDATTHCRPMEMREGAADGSLPADPALEATLSDRKLWYDLDGVIVVDVGDADADGLADLLLWNTISSGDGVVRVLYGARAGLGTGRDTATVASDLGNSFGARAAVGDMTGDGRPDLLVSAPSFRNHDGRLTLVPGTSDGSPAPIDRATSMDSTTEGLPGTRNPYEWNDFSSNPPLLDMNGDDHDDAVLFLPLYEKRKGMFLVVYGTNDGLTPDRTAHFTLADVGGAPHSLTSPSSPSSPSR